MVTCVISNAFNFLAERTIETVGGQVDLVVHVDKSDELVFEFNSALCQREVTLPPTAHKDVIHHVLNMHENGETILFVDHDICFEGSFFSDVKSTWDAWFRDDQDLLVAYPDLSGHRNPFPFNTCPMFASRVHPRTTETEAWGYGMSGGRHLDTGQRLVRRLEDEGLARGLLMEIPRLHLTSFWGYYQSGLRRTKQGQDQRAWRTEAADSILKEGGFRPSPRELDLMKRFEILSLFRERRMSVTAFNRL